MYIVIPIKKNHKHYQFVPLQLCYYYFVPGQAASSHASVDVNSPTLSSAGKANDATTLEQPVETSFVNVLGVSTFGHMPTDRWFGDNGVHHTGFRSGLSEIRVFGCTEGKPII